MKVDIYRNLNIPNDDPCKWSVLDRSNRKVIDRVQTAHVKDVEFVVQPAGRKRVLEEQRKNVHAGVRGYLEHPDPSFSVWDDIGWWEMTPVTYNPYRYESFVDKRTETPRWFASFVQLHPQEVRAISS